MGIRVVIPADIHDEVSRFTQAARLIATCLSATIEVIESAEANQQMRSPTALDHIEHETPGTAPGRVRTILALDATRLLRCQPEPHWHCWPGPLLLVPATAQQAQPTFQHILVMLTSPDRDETRRAIPFAAQLALGGGARLGIAMVIDVDGGGATTAQATELYTIQRYLHDVATRLRCRDIRVSWETRIGPPLGEMTRLVETTAPDLIVAGPSAKLFAAHIVERTGRPLLLQQ